MSRPTPRRLTMADLAILTAGAALSFAILRMSWDTSSSTLASISSAVVGSQSSVVIISLSLGAATALIGMRIIGPRPRWRAVFRQPGTSACLAILAYMLMVVLLFSWHEVLKPASALSRFRIDFNLHLSGNRFAGTWVAVAWTTLALARAWRPEPSWIDRSGRILGVVVILHWLRSAVNW
jgi:hypothetical protein